jgi:hypothetical protein
MTRPEYTPGQAWTYRTRPGAEASRVIIRKKDIEPEDGEVFHISILDARLRNHRVDGGIQHAMHHAAVARATLDQSLLDCVGEGDEDEAWMDGYEVWRHAYDRGDAGVFDIPVAEILGYIERVVAASGEK